jgi:hypothetical protein
MAPFRDASEQLAAEAAALAHRRRAEAAATPRGWRSIYVHRVARVAFGVTATLGAAVTATTMVLGVRGLAARIAAAWAVALAVYLAALVVASLRLRRRIAAAVTITGEPVDDLARLRAVSPRQVEHAMSSRLGRASHRWPLVAAVLLGPHSCQLPVMRAIDFLPGGADEYMAITVVFGGHLFAYGLWAAWRYPVRRAVGGDIVMVCALSALVAPFTLGLSIVATLGTAVVLGLVAFGPMGCIIDGEQARLAAAEAAISADAHVE